MRQAGGAERRAQRRSAALSGAAHNLPRRRATLRAAALCDERGSALVPAIRPAPFHTAVLRRGVAPPAWPLVAAADLLPCVPTHPLKPAISWRGLAQGVVPRPALGRARASTQAPEALCVLRACGRDAEQRRVKLEACAKSMPVVPARHHAKQGDARVEAVAIEILHVVRAAISSADARVRSVVL